MEKGRGENGARQGQREKERERDFKFESQFSMNRYSANYQVSISSED